MSMNATASMYPAPSARKYPRNFLGQSLRTTKYPPTKFPAAATSPSPAASAVRNATSCPILFCALCVLCAFRTFCELCVNSQSFSLPLPSSSRMPKKNHIPFLHHVFFSLQPHLRLLPRGPQTSRRQQVIPPHHFRPDKSLLDVAMNRSCRLHCRRSLSNRPRAHFRLPRREKLDQSQQIIRSANQSVQPRLLQSIGRQQLRRLFLLHFRKFRFQP